MNGSTADAGGASPGAGGASNGATAGSGAAALGCDRMDILFVIDNSGSMQQEQMNLAANFPKFIEVLDSFRAGALDYRVGVTTTAFPRSVLGFPVSGGEEGALLKSGGMQNPWLSRNDPNVAQTLTNIATVGTDGSGQEQPLRAARAAVTAPMADGANAGFLRKDALLAVIFLTDEDDQSAGEDMMVGGLPIPLSGAEIPVSEFVTKFDEIKGDRTRWATAVVAGGEAPSCTSQFGDAAYAGRLLDFTMATGDNAVFSSICEGDLSKALEDALHTFSAACDNFVVI